ncbi:hypothetical protein BVX98_03065 [bacterium F11]|nr:hypothetical protein BVX98_03065 [bacterium F11]
MVRRHFWLEKIEEAWSHRSVLWLAGVRRSGKTTLCQTLSSAEVFDCELPRTRRLMEDPEAFLKSFKNKRIVLDEIHRLDNPSELLKIAADYFPDTKIVATGSSSLAASTHFKDKLTGRKSTIWLTPLMSSDLNDFGETSLKHRFLKGGLPPFFLNKKSQEKDFQEWIDAFWAKDIQDLFRLERRHSFMKFAELLMVNSGGLFEASKFAGPCEVSRVTISNYLRVLEETFVVHVVRPFHTRRSVEILSAPKVYSFDTGFTCFFKGWQTLRPDDMGFLWEHFVLNEIMAQMQTRDIRYWRDKMGHEIDFIWAPRGKPPFTVECKWSSRNFDGRNIRVFRRHYPQGKDLVVAHDIDRPYIKRMGNREIQFTSLSHLPEILRNHQ